MFRRQVYAPTIEQGIAEECLKVTASHNRKLLRDVGLDFTFLLSTLLQPDPSSSSNIQLHPSFQITSVGETPAIASGYSLAIDSSPFPGYAKTPAPEDDIPPPSGSTQPLSINPKSPRKVRPDGTSPSPAPGPTGSQPAASPASPRSTRRVVSAPRTQVVEGPEDEGLR